MIAQLWAILPGRRRRRLVVVVVVAVAAAVAEAAVVLLVGPLIEALAEATAVGADESPDATGPLVVFGLALVVKNVVVVGLSWFKNRELFAIQAEVSERLLDSYIRGTNPQVRDLDAGQRTSFAITEPLQLVLNCYQPVVTIAAEALALVAVTSVVIVERPIEATILVLLLGAGLKLFSAATRARIVGYGERRKQSDTRRMELVRSIIESRVEVKGLGVSSSVLGRYRAPNAESAEMTARKAFLTEAAKNVLELLVVAALGPLALLLIYAEGSELLAVLAMFGMAAYRAMPALNRIMVSSQSTKFGVATADTIHRILSADDRDRERREHDAEERDASADASVGDLADLELRFDGFELRNGKPVLDGRTVRLSRGEVCVLWGPSGSGKSTLLEALIDGAEGVDIRFEGRRLPGGLSELEGRVGVTAQSPLVLPVSIRENLTLGHDPATLDIEAAIPLLDADARSILDASSIRERLDVAIHRHAVSGGQAQRISLIRALDRSRDVVLLDEPTSALDARAASALRDRIANAADGRIFVIATHDPELRSLADVVVEVG